MDVREKLVELIAQKVCDTWSESCDEWLPHDCGKCYANDCHISEVADHLISNGVTVQEWTPVTDSPKGKGCYIVVVNHWVDGKPVTREAYWNGCDWLSCDKKWELTPRVTHWMPLPQPPKGAYK